MASEKQKQIAWKKAEEIHGKNPALHRRGRFGNEIYRPSYGKDSPIGVGGRPLETSSLGGTDHSNNLQGLQTEENRRKGDRSPYRE